MLGLAALSSVSERDQKQNTAQYDAFLLQLHKFGSEVFFLGGREGGGAGRGGEFSGVARHVGIAFNFTKHRKRFTSPLGLYLSEFSEGSTHLKRQALRFWFPPENSR